MVNPLYLPELRLMIAENNSAELKEFCEALHPARTADFMEGLTAEECWTVLSHTGSEQLAEIFLYFDKAIQIEMIETLDRKEMAGLVAELAADDRVDLLNDVRPEIVEELLPLLPSGDRRDILHLRSYPEGTAGAVMTTEVAMLAEELTVRDALEELQRISEDLETIYYLYIVDDNGHLRGLVSARQLLSSIGKNLKLGDLMETGLVSAEVDDDQEEVARKVAKYDLLAIPVVDLEHKLLGIITYDDVMDVVVEEATEDAHRSAAVEPLEDDYLQTSIVTLAWKRGIWLFILFVAALLTAFALRGYEADLEKWPWLVLFLPLIISSGGNTGNQSATLVITGLNKQSIRVSDWSRVLQREFVLGLMLGCFLAACGFAASWAVTPAEMNLSSMWVIPLTLVSVVLCGSLVGSCLPLFFQRIGLAPALMSNPFVAGIIDIFGIVLYMTVAWFFLT